MGEGGREGVGDGGREGVGEGGREDLGLLCLSFKAQREPPSYPNQLQLCPSSPPAKMSPSADFNIVGVVVVVVDVVVVVSEL